MGTNHNYPGPYQSNHNRPDGQSPIQKYSRFLLASCRWSLRGGRPLTIWKQIRTASSTVCFFLWAREIFFFFRIQSANLATPRSVKGDRPGLESSQVEIPGGMNLSRDLWIVRHLFTPCKPVTSSTTPGAHGQQLTSGAPWWPKSDCWEWETGQRPIYYLPLAKQSVLDNGVGKLELLDHLADVPLIVGGQAPWWPESQILPRQEHLILFPARPRGHK